MTDLNSIKTYVWDATDSYISSSFVAPTIIAGRHLTDIKVKVGKDVKVLNTDYEIQVNPQNANAVVIKFTQAGEPTLGDPIRIYRQTSHDTKLVDFVDGSLLTSKELDDSADQLFNMAQEAYDKGEETTVGKESFYYSQGSDPTNGVSGAVPAGTLWYDTSSSTDTLQVYSGSEWQATAPAKVKKTYQRVTTNGFLQVANDAHSAGKTKFADTAFKAHSSLYLNGVKLVEAAALADIPSKGDYFLSGGDVILLNLSSDTDVLVSETFDGSFSSSVTASEANALDYKNQAGLSASGASISAGQAGGYRDLAKDARDDAQKYADTAKDTPFTTSSGTSGQLSAKHYAETAATHASTASSAATSSAVTTVSGDLALGNSSLIKQVADIDDKVTAVADKISQVDSLSTKTTELGILGAGNIPTDIGTVAAIDQQVIDVAAIHPNVTTVAGMVSGDITKVANIDTKVTDLANIDDKLEDLHAKIPEINTITTTTNLNNIAAVGGDINDVTTVAGISSQIDTLAESTYKDKVEIVADSAYKDKVTTVAGMQTAVNNVATNANIASVSASTAVDKANEASVSETNAASSMNSASSHATNANSYKNAAQSAQIAAEAASTSASSSKTQAAASALSATASENQAEVYMNASNDWGSFYQKRYLGDASSNPSVDTAGNALQNGALYFNTSDNTMYVFNGSTWVAAESTINNVNYGANLAANLNTNSHDISFGDNDKAQFGAGNDLQIYHDGSSSIIQDSGTGGLYLKGSNEIALRSSSNENIFLGLTDGSAYVYHNGDVKLQTTSTGIDVTGNVSLADNGKATFGASDDLQIYHDGTTSRIRNTEGNLKIQATSNGENAIDITPNGAVGVFYDGIQKLTTTSTGIDVTGTVTADGLTVNSGAVDIAATIESSDSAVRLAFAESGSTGNNHISLESNEWYIYSNSTERLRIDSSGRVGIGTSSPSEKLHVASASGAVGAEIESAINTDAYLRITESGTSGAELKYEGSTNKFHIGTGAAGTFTNRMTFLRDSGNVGIGTSSPKQQLHISGGTSSGDVTKVAIGATGNNAETHLQLAERFTGDNMNYGFSFVADGNDTNNLLIKNHDNSTTGDVALSVARGTGFIGINKEVANSPLDVNAGTTNKVATFTSTDATAFIQIVDSNTTSAAHGYGVNGNNLSLYANDSERMRIDSSGNVGIGTSSPARKLVIQDTGAQMSLLSANTGSSVLNLGDTDDDNIGRIQYDNQNNKMLFRTNTVDRLIIDSSGNVLVGKTSATATDLGCQIENDGQIKTTTNGQSALTLNRKTSDGLIALFQKDGVTVGSINSYAGTRLAIGSNGVSGAVFGQNAVIPATSGTTLVNNAYDLGTSSYKWKDLYLSGGVQLGGTGSANKLDDYEEGTWTPSFNGYSTGFTGTYTKIGDIVHCRIARTTAIASGSITGSVIITGLPFTAQRAYTSPLGQIRGTTTTGASSRPYGIVHGSVVGLFTDDSFGDVAYYNASSANWDGSNFKQNSTAIYMAWEFTYRV